MYMNNEIGIQRDFETKLMKYIYKLAQTLDEAALTKLAAAKTAVIKNPLLYDKTGNVINAKWTERENLLGDLNVIMGANDFYGQFCIHFVNSKTHGSGIVDVGNSKNGWYGHQDAIMDAYRNAAKKLNIKN